MATKKGSQKKSLVKKRPVAKAPTPKKATSAKSSKEKAPPKKAPQAKAPQAKTMAKASASKSGQPVLLSGGNPQIPKGDGPGPVRAYLAAVPGWKKGQARRLDALIEKVVPHVKRAIRWNSPFYGVEGQGWFVGYHCFDKYIKVNFLRGTSLAPLPPVGSRDPNARYYHITEDEFDEKALASWIKQAASVPGDTFF